MSYPARSPRQSSALRAVLVDGAVQSAGRVLDMSSTGLLVSGPAGLEVGRKVSVVRMVDDEERARQPAEVVRRDGRDRAGLRYLPSHEHTAGPEAAPSLFLAEAWDDEDPWVAPLPEPVSALAPSARFAVRPDTVERLRRFVARDLESGGTTLFVSELLLPGTRVAVVLVHPANETQLELPAVVLRAYADPPRRVELAFLATDAGGRAELERFLDAGGPQREQPPAAGELALENTRLRTRVAELEEALEESERTERSFLQKLQDLERRLPR